MTETVELLERKILDLEIQMRAQTIASHRPIRLNAEEAARYLGYEGGRCLERLRADGSGPAFQKTGNRVFYLISDLDEWAISQANLPQRRIFRHYNSIQEEIERHERFKNIEKRRIEKGISRSTLCGKAGYCYSAYSQFVMGKRYPKIDTLSNFEEALNQLEGK